MFDRIGHTPRRMGRWSRSRAFASLPLSPSRLTLSSGIAIWRGSREADRAQAPRLQCFRSAAKYGCQGELSFKEARVDARANMSLGRLFSCGSVFQRLFREPSRMAGSIVVRTRNPLDITPDEAAEIAARIRSLNLDGEVRVEEQEREDRGLTWFEFLYITLAFKVGRIVVEEAAKKITDIVVDWARQRFRGRKSGSKRPVYLEIHVRDDLGERVVKSIVIKNATDEPEDRTEKKQIRIFERG